MTRVLLATCADLPDGDEDAGLLVGALARAGVDACWSVWDDPAVAWDDALVVLRSTWDYTVRRAEFLAWVGSLARVANEAAAVTWSSDKAYLGDLVAAGVPTVETVFVAPGDDVPDVLPSGELVVKPSVGAGSRGAGRFAGPRRAAIPEHVAALHAAGRTAMVQPYLAEVDTRGESALVYVDGRFSHAVRKGPMLPDATTHAVDAAELYVEEDLTARTADAAELAVGESVMTVVRERFGRDQLYARVDLLPGDDGPVVVELELVEPSLFLGLGGDGAADRLAAAVAARG